MTDSHGENESALSFPCRFPVKVMGRATTEFRQTVLDVLSLHVPDVGENDLQYRDSRDGNFLSITVEIEATSREQLDSLYQALNDSDDVLMTL